MNFVDISMKGKLFKEYNLIFNDCQKTEKFLPQGDRKILLGPGCGYWDWFAFVPQLSYSCMVVILLSLDTPVSRNAAISILQMGNKGR